MIEINLLPDQLRKKARKAKQASFSFMSMSGIDWKKLPFLNIAAIAVGSLVVFHIILFAVGAYSKSRCASTKKAYDRISAEKNEYESLKSQVDIVNKKVRAIDDLMVKRFSWTRKLNALGDSVTPGIWLVDLYYIEKDSDRVVQRPDSRNQSGTRTKKNLPTKSVTERIKLRYLVMSGYASSMGEEGTALVGKFIKSLKDNPSFYSDFSDIELGSIRSERVQDQEVMSFRITCLFNEAE